MLASKIRTVTRGVCWPQRLGNVIIVFTSTGACNCVYRVNCWKVDACMLPDLKLNLTDVSKLQSLRWSVWYGCQMLPLLKVYYSRSSRKRPPQIFEKVVLTRAGRLRE